MSSLWTPGGEHSVPPTPAPSPPPPQRPARRRPDREEGSEPSEEEAAQALGEMRARILATPVAEIVTDHAAALLELAVLHLGLDPDASQESNRGGSNSGGSNLDEASLAIDAMAALVEGLGARLGPHGGPLASALASLRLAYVRALGTGPSGQGA
ncbi:MAG: hypothetical protein ACRDV9_11320 [Acidimicrobiia bacterium]